MSRICLAVENALNEEGIYPLGGLSFPPHHAALTYHGRWA